MKIAGRKYNSIVDLNHSYISPYGELLGNTFRVNVSLDKSFDNSDDYLINRFFTDYYLGKVWIVESYSSLVLTTSIGTWDIVARRQFPTDFEDTIKTLDPLERVTIKTDGVEMKVAAGKLAFVATHHEWGMNTMYSDYGALVVDHMSAHLSEYLSSSLIETVAIVDFNQPVRNGYDDGSGSYSGSSIGYVKIGAETGVDGITYQGFNAKVKTGSLGTESTISAIYDKALFIDTTDGVLTDDLYTIGDEYIKFSPVEFNESTNLRLNIVSISDVGINSIALMVFGGFVSVYNDCSLTEGNKISVSVVS